MEHKKIFLKKHDLSRKDWMYKLPFSKDVSIKITAPATIYDSEKPDKILAVLERVKEPPGLARRLFDDVQYANGQRTQGLKAKAKTFGYMPRVKIMIAKQACRRSALAAEQPEVNSILLDWARDVGEKIYREQIAEQYEKHKEIVTSKVHPRYMASEVFTSGIINHTNRLPYHVDAGNFNGCWSVMLVVRSDKIGGGNLIIPEYDAELICENGAVVIFNGAEVFHGVSEIFNPDPSKEYRFSIVFYSMEQLWQCLSPEEELKKVRRMRDEVESAPRSIQRIKGKNG